MSELVKKINKELFVINEYTEKIIEYCTDKATTAIKKREERIKWLKKQIHQEQKKIEELKKYVPKKPLGRPRSQ